MMDIKVIGAEYYEPLDLKSLPDGRYEGIIGGYEVVCVLSSGKRARFTTDDGVRGFNIPCVVVVRDGSASVEFK